MNRFKLSCKACLGALFLNAGNSLQGAATVMLNNYDAEVPIKLIWCQTPPTNLMFQVLGGPPGGVLLALATIGASNSVFTGIGTGSAPGYFDGGIGLVAGIADNNLADFQVRAWVGPPDSAYETAEIKGATTHWTQETGSWDPYSMPPKPPVGPALRIPGPIVMPGPCYYQLGIEEIGPGSVVLDPAPYYSSYPAGTKVTLTASPQAGTGNWTWIGDVSGTNSQVSLTMDGDKQVSILFGKAWRVAIAASEGGRVTIHPAGSVFRDGDTIEITAQPLAGYKFAGWTGNLNWPVQARISCQVTQEVVMQADFQATPPEIASHPQSQNAVLGGTVVFAVQASGLDLKYAWFFNGAALVGATNASLVLQNVTMREAGVYRCEVSNPMGTVSSATASLAVYVELPPAIKIQPASQTVKQGDYVLISLAAVGSDLHYQWYGNGALLPGCTTNILIFNSASTNNSGNYWCVVSNGSGQATSETAILKVLAAPPPAIYSQPASQSAYEGDYVSLYVGANGNNLRYQWYRNGTAVPGAAGPGLNFYPVTASQAGDYWCVVSNANGQATSATARLTVRPRPPTIYGQPQSLTVKVGDTADFSVSSSGSGLNYVWYWEGTPVPGGTNAVLTLSNVTTNQAGSYWCQVSNSLGTATSTMARLVVLVPIPPTLYNQPVSQTVKPGADVYFYVGVGGPDLQFRWLRDGATFSGGAVNPLILRGVTTNQAGRYWCRVANGGGSVTSAPATLVVVAPQPPKIIRPPGAQTAHVGGQVGFSVAAIGEAPLDFQWQFNGVAVPGATEATLWLEDVQLAQAGNYTVAVSNSVGVAISAGAVLQVLPEPAITVQPQSRVAAVGAPVTFRVAAEGSPPLAYQWRRNGTVIAGAASPALVLDPVQPAEAGTYQVEVSNAAGAVTSAEAVLVVKEGPGFTDIRISEGSVALAFVSEPGRKYRVEVSPDLVNWQAVETVVSDRERMEYRLQLRPEPGRWFYRMVLENGN